MPNLTAGADVALQVGTGALNRLLAGLHAQGRILHELDLPVADLGPGATGIVGQVQAQLGTPILGIEPGQPARLGVSYRVRARFLAAEGSPSFPEWVQGTVKVTADPGRALQVSAGMLRVDLAGLSDVTFEPLGRLPADQAARAGQLATNLLRSGLGHVHEPVEPPPELQVGPVRPLPAAGGPAAVAALLGLGREPAPADTGPDVLVRAPEEFAVGVAGDAVAAGVRDQVVPLLTPQGGHLWGPVEWSFTPDPGSLAIRFEAGRIAVSISGQGTAGPLGFAVHATIGIRLGLDSAGRPTAALDPPEVRVESPIAPLVEPVIAAQATGGLGPLAGEVRARVAELAARLDAAAILNRFGVHARAQLVALELHPEGLLLRGRLRFPPLGAATASYVTRGEERDAFRSWVAGGWVERVRWSAMCDNPFGVSETFEETGRFALALPERCRNSPQVCLAVVGSWQDETGRRHEVTRATCTLQGPQFPWVDDLYVLGPLLAGQLRLPGPQGDPAPWERVADVDLGRLVLPASSPANLVLHVTGEDVAKEVGALVQAVREREFGTAVLAVAPAGTRHLVEDVDVGPHAALLLAEDVSGAAAGWLLGKEGKGEPQGTTAIFRPDGQEAWRGGLDDLGAALDEHLDREAQLTWRPLSAAVPTGQDAPDLTLVDGSGLPVALHKLFGRPIVLCFWSLASKASLDELGRLVGDKESQKEGALVVPVNAGDPVELASATLAELGVDGLSAFDETREVVSAYGIGAVPTVVTIDELGRVTSVREGGEPELSDEEPPG